MIDKELIVKLVEEKLASSSNYLVDVAVQPGNIIVVEIDNDESVCIDDCVELSRYLDCLLYTSPSPRDMRRSRMPSSA